MAPDANPRPHASEDRADEAALARIAGDLLTLVDEVSAGWVADLVRRRYEQWQGSVPSEVEAAARQAGIAAHDELMPVLERLLTADVDEQAANPLALLRAITGYAADALRSLGVAPVVRERFAEEAFPDDVYDLAPATWSDIDPRLQEAGITWGAAKAFVHRARHASTGGSA